MYCYTAKNKNGSSFCSFRYASHVSGIAAGNGHCSGGKYEGIAPEANIISVKILDHLGRGNTARVLSGIQWVMDNKKRYNIRVMNLSIGAAEADSRDPLVKAVEAAWDQGIVITIAAGNNGPTPSSVTSPGTSRKVITVGTSDDYKEIIVSSNSLVNFSGRGPTPECIVKPDVVAPGANIISCLTPTPANSRLTSEESKIINKHYLQLSGTSMSTPIVTGAIALLLEKYPSLVPDDVKFMLKKCAVNLNYPKNQQGWGIIDVENLLLQEETHVRE